MSDPYLSEVRMFSFNYNPRGWQMCNGQTLAINTFAALFSLLGTTYGGNGVSTFLLPNLQGRVPVHFGTGPGLPTVALGEVSGEINHTITMTEMALHNHNVKANSTAQTATATANTSYPGSGNLNAYGTSPDTAMNAGIVGFNGGSQPHNNLQPYLVINFCIATTGIFPTRS